MTRQATKVKAEELQDLILNRITKLRPKLLDLSRRNPLISTNLGTRSNSIVRVVDELPDDLSASVSGGSKMRFLPLPALDEDPRDEKTKAFQTALSQARHTDEVFVAAMEALDQKSDKAIEEGRRIDRALRDRLREQLGMPARQQGKDVSLPQHAINNGIAPSYELPKPEDAHHDGRHEDENIQTLFLPEDLERKLNALTTKCKSWAQETGINVLQAAFGFLEWTEPNKTDSAFAPLVLLPVEIEKKKTSAGPEFWVGSAGEDPQTNLVLAEKLRIDFGIMLPPYEGGSLEEYFEKVAAVSPKIIKWKVRRQVAFGVFPSARMAMYNDLAIGKHDFENSEIISSLFGGAGASGATPFADDYEVDKPEIEAKVPALVLDADSSQFSTIVDVAHGKNLAVEGPPGTGKSQTIVNTIAAAIGQGKKVLFIAEKTAALNVVKSRLEAVGLGEFLLPLQAERSNRKLVSQSMKERLEMQAGPSPAEYASKIEWFKKTRAQLAEYVEVIGKPYGATGLSVYAVIGKSLVGNQLLAGLPQELQRADIKSIETFDQTRIAEICETAMAAEKAWRGAQDAKRYWSGLNIAHADKFKVDELSDQAKDVAKTYARTSKARAALTSISLDEETDLARLSRLANLLSPLNEKMSELDRDLLIRMCRQPQFSLLGGFLERCVAAQKAEAELGKSIVDQADRDLPKRLRSAQAQCEDSSMDTLSVAAWREHVEKRAQLLAAQRRLFAQLEPVIGALPQFATLGLAYLLKAGALVRDAGKGVLSLRAPSHAEAATSLLLQQLCASGAQLAARRDNVRSTFAILPDVSSAELLEHARNIRGAGFFARFGKNFQAAKKIYASHASKQFDRATAANELQAAAELRSSTIDFQSNPQAQALFGIHFKGLDTNFDSFSALAKYYDAIDEAFAGVALKELRAFLKSADLDDLLLLSELPDQKPVGTFQDLKRTIAESEALLLKVQEGAGRIGALSSGLVAPDTFEVGALEKLSYELEANQKLCAQLDQDEGVRGLLGSKWNGWKTQPDTVAAELRIATEIKSDGGFAGLLTSWLEQGRLQDAQLLVRDVLDGEKAAQTATSALTRLSGVDFTKQLQGKRASDCADYMTSVSADRDGIQFHSIYHTQKEELRRHGFDWVLRSLLENGHSLEGLSAKIEAVIFRSMAIAVYASYGAILSKYPGDRLDAYRAQLAKLDRDIIRLSRQHLRRQIHSAARPPAGNGQGRRTTWTQLALIENEANKVQGHISLRELNERAGEALREIKPCWMMSPPRGRAISAFKQSDVRSVHH